MDLFLLIGVFIFEFLESKSCRLLSNLNSVDHSLYRISNLLLELASFSRLCQLLCSLELRLLLHGTWVLEVACVPESLELRWWLLHLGRHQLQLRYRVLGRRQLSDRVLWNGHLAILAFRHGSTTTGLKRTLGSLPHRKRHRLAGFVEVWYVQCGLSGIGSQLATGLLFALSLLLVVRVIRNDEILNVYRLLPVVIFLLFRGLLYIFSIIQDLFWFWCRQRLVHAELLIVDIHVERVKLFTAHLHHRNLQEIGNGLRDALVELLDRPFGVHGLPLRQRFQQLFGDRLRHISVHSPWRRTIGLGRRPAVPPRTTTIQTRILHRRVTL